MREEGGTFYSKKLLTFCNSITSIFMSYNEIEFKINQFETSGVTSNKNSYFDTDLLFSYLIYTGSDIHNLDGIKCHDESVWQLRRHSLLTSRPNFLVKMVEFSCYCTRYIFGRERWIALFLFVHVHEKAVKVILWYIDVAGRIRFLDH